MSEQERKWFHEGYPPNVVCYIAQGAENPFAVLKEDMEVKLVGKVIGSRKAPAWRGHIVELEDCRAMK
jgi:hypothetical protein